MNGSGSKLRCQLSVRPRVPFLPCPLTAQAMRRQRRTCDSFPPLQEPTHGRESLESGETGRCRPVLKSVVSHRHSSSPWPPCDNIVSVHRLLCSFPSFCARPDGPLTALPGDGTYPREQHPAAPGREASQRRPGSCPSWLSQNKALLGPGLTAGDARLTYVSPWGWP